MSYKDYVGINTIALVAASLATGFYMYASDKGGGVPADDPSIVSSFVAPLILSIPALALCAASYVQVARRGRG